MLGLHFPFTYTTDCIGQDWENTLNDRRRFFQIIQSGESGFETASLLALSACIDGIEEYGKQVLRA
jgi:hypothetical protein